MALDWRGKANGRYDLPLSHNGSGRFIILLIALMTFLAVLALSASFALSGMAARWSSGLENKMTIEIPATDSKDEIRSDETLNTLKIKVKKELDNIENIKAIDVMSEQSVSELLAPWLGEDFALDDVAMPTLIAVETRKSSKDSIQSLRDTLKAIDPTIQLDTHEEWLQDFLRLIGSMKFATIFVSLIIGITTTTAIAGVIRARMAEHKPDVELLHLMGASDAYIAGQFERYAMRLGLVGGTFGLLAGFIGLIIFKAGLGVDELKLVPQMGLSKVALVTLLSLPVIACVLCAATAKITVLRTLSRMP